MPRISLSHGHMKLAASQNSNTEMRPYLQQNIIITLVNESITVPGTKICPQSSPALLLCSLLPGPEPEDIFCWVDKQLNFAT